MFLLTPLNLLLLLTIENPNTDNESKNNSFTLASCFHEYTAEHKYQKSNTIKIIEESFVS